MKTKSLLFFFLLCCLSFWNQIFSQDDLYYSPKMKSIAKNMKFEDMLKLTVWSRGIRLQSRKDTTVFAYLWFYEWHLFDAVMKGEHTPGTWSWKWTINNNNTVAQMDSQGIKMTINATGNGADMVMEITNTTNYDWPEIAAIIPCFNPGGAGSKRNPFRS
jgi:hypothetical protein